MKLVITILFLFTFEKSISQENIVVVQRNCLDDLCVKIKKREYTFNQKGQIQNYIFFGDYHRADTNYVANLTKFKYYKSKILARVNYRGKYLSSKINYSYRNGRLSAVKDDNSIITYYYNNNGKVSSTIMLEGLDTLRIVKYKYKQNELIEIFRYTNKIDNERITYSKSNDTIIETRDRHDSINIEKLSRVITRKKYEDSKIIYSYCLYEHDKSSEENIISYDSFDNVMEINRNSNAKNLNKKEKSKFIYKNGLIDKIENLEFVNNIWQRQSLIDYDVHKSNKMPKDKIKRQINSYLIQTHFRF